jgi:hypothetical protein
MVEPDQFSHEALLTRPRKPDGGMPIARSYLIKSI